MKRRSLLKQGMVGGVTSAVAMACRPKKPLDTALKEQTVLSWRMTTSWPRFVPNFVGADTFNAQNGEFLERFRL